MAINKMLHINAPTKRSPHAHLQKAIEYILNPEKTQNNKNSFGINCNVDTALDEFINIKSVFGQLGDKRENDRQAYHFIISFSPDDEVSPELSSQITKEFCEKYLKNRYQCIIATHDDQPHMHSHIIFNSVALDSGKKYHYKNGDWKRNIAPILNELCEKHNLSTIELGGLEKSDLKFDQKRDNGITKIFLNSIKKEIDDTVKIAYSFDDLMTKLKIKGYEIKYRGKNVSVKAPGMQRFRRLSGKMGDEYTIDVLKSRIEKNNKKEKQHYYKKKVTFDNYNNASITKAAKVMCMRYIRIIDIGGKPYTVSKKYESDLRQLQNTMDKYWFLKEYHVKKWEDISNVEDKIKTFIEHSKDKKRDIQNKKRQIKKVLGDFSRIKDLTPAYKCYESGDLFFEKEAKEYMNLKKSCLENSFKDEESVRENLRELHKEYSGLLCEENKMRKKLKIADECKIYFMKKENDEREKDFILNKKIERR